MGLRVCVSGRGGMPWAQRALASPLFLGEAGGDGCVCLSVQSLVRPPWLRHGDCCINSINPESKCLANEYTLPHLPPGDLSEPPGMWFQFGQRLLSPRKFSMGRCHRVTGQTGW